MRIFNRPSVSTRTSGSFPFVLWRFPAPCFPASHYLHCTLCIAISNWLTFERSIWDRSDSEYNMTNENEEYSWRIEHTIDNRRYHPCIYTCFTHFLSWKITFFIFRSGARFLSKKIKNRDKKFKLFKDSFNPHSPGHTVLRKWQKSGFCLSPENGEVNTTLTGT